MEIKVYATLRDIVGGKSVQLEGVSQITVQELLDTLCERYPDMRSELYNGKDTLHSAIHILINGRDMRYLEGLETVISSDKEVRIFPPVGGGI